MVQLREKDLGGRALGELARELLPLCRARGAPLLINDRVEVALALGLEGVHLPAASFPVGAARALLGPDRLLGVSCHYRADVAAARAGGADYATFGPLFDTPSKRTFGAPLGLAALSDAALEGLPLFGLGGVEVERAAGVARAGARGVAVIGAWLGAGDPATAVEQLVAAVDRARS